MKRLAIGAHDDDLDPVALRELRHDHFGRRLDRRKLPPGIGVEHVEALRLRQLS
ncbi:hypothetical protein [Sphingomonas glacialis]|uniref:hypothetical protein n=1 Tax=Sphingomonas glacialis TaxID=658225 RepID=UPI001F4FC2F5|nr:hypothetical protein [Sphingomonas glacialis]